MTKTKALLAVLALLTLSVAYADVQVFVLSGRIAGNQQRDTQALCSLRDDVQRRMQSTKDFLRTHPSGFPGISAATLRVTIDNEKHTVMALSPLKC